MKGDSDIRNPVTTAVVCHLHITLNTGAESGREPPAQVLMALCSVTSHCAQTWQHPLRPGAQGSWSSHSLEAGVPGHGCPGASLPLRGRLCQGALRVHRVHSSTRFQEPQNAHKLHLGVGCPPVTAPLREMGTGHLKPLSLTLRTTEFYRDARVSSPRRAGKAPPPSRGHRVPCPALQ